MCVCVCVYVCVCANMCVGEKKGKGETVPYGTSSGSGNIQKFQIPNSCRKEQSEGQNDDI